MNTLLAAGATGDPLVDWLTQAGSVGVLAVVVVLFLRGKLVTEGALKRALEERDRAMDLVFQLAETARRAVTVAEETKTK